MRFTFGVASLFLWLLMVGCTGDTGPEGPAGDPGADGDPGTAGDPGGNGTDGQDGADGRNPLLVGPGLEIEILEASIDTSNIARVRYRVTDSAGHPLDLDGLFTEGAVSPRFLLAWLDETDTGEPLQYTSYSTNSDGQAATDSGGVNVEIGVGDGTYEYTYATPASGTTRSYTHTVGIQASRTFEGLRYDANETYNFVPAGGPVTVTREVVKTEACNGCHNPLQIHGRRRRKVELCVLCHQPQTVDADNGNTADFRVMIHKIHRGADLPSVKAGGDYEIGGHNYNDVEFPHDLRSCDTCHSGANGDFWKTRPTRAACGSCHDLTSWEALENVPPGMVQHDAGEIPDDTSCTNIGCHRETGGLGGIVDKHMFQAIDPSTPELTVTIDAVNNSGPGSVVDVDFTVKVDGVARDILTTPLDRLRFTIAGPTTDYKSYFQVTAQGSGSSGTLSALDAPAGKFKYTFSAGNALPGDASGSYGLAIEARIPSPSGNVNAFNPIAYFAVTGPKVDRRKIAAQSGCDSCHLQLSGHGGSRRNVEYCAFCHHPNNTNDERVSAVEGTTEFVNTVDLKVMIHKIHRGKDLVNDYVLGTSGPTTTTPAGEPHDFTTLRFPGDLRDCGTCHVAGSFSLPLGEDVLPSRFESLECTEPLLDDLDDLCESRVSTQWYVTPTTAVCTACHDSNSTAAHAEIMTTVSLQESCATCHGPGSAFDIANYHRLDP